LAQQAAKEAADKAEQAKKATNDDKPKRQARAPKED